MMDQEQIKTLFADFGLECYKAYTDNNLRIPDSLQEKYDAIFNHEMAEASGIAIGEEMFCLDPDTYPFRMVKVIVKGYRVFKDGIIWCYVRGTQGQLVNYDTSVPSGLLFHSPEELQAYFTDFFKNFLK